MNRIVKFGLASLATLYLGSGAMATPILTPTLTEGTDVAFTVNTTNDIILNGATSLSGTPVTAGFTSYGGSSPATLNDGTMGGHGDISTTAFSYPSSPFTTTFNLNTDPGSGGTPTGYTISEIDTYTGWATGRIDQSYTVSYATVASPTFVQIVGPGPGGTFNLDASSVESPNYSGYSSGLLQVTDSSGILAAGVTALQFAFLYATTGPNAEPVWREAAVIGTPTVPVPEPAGIVMAVIGLVACGGFGLKVRRTAKV